MPVEMDITDYLHMCQWHDSLPSPLQPLAEQFNLSTKWLPYGRELPEGGWLIPRSIHTDGTIDMLECEPERGEPFALVPHVPPAILVRLYEH